MNTTARSSVYSVAFSPDGKTVAALPCGTGSVSLWCPKTGHKVAIQNFTPAISAFYPSVAFSPQGYGTRAEAKLAARCVDGTVYLWNSCKSKERSETDGKLIGHRGWVRSLAFTADGSKLVSGGNDCGVQLWDVSTHRQLVRFSGHTGYVLSVATTGNKIVSGGNDSTVRILDMSTATELLQMNDHHEWVESVEGGPNTNIVASTGGYDKNIRLWDMSTGQQIAKLDGHTLTR